jgi:hypothetical protein
VRFALIAVHGTPKRADSERSRRLAVSSNQISEGDPRMRSRTRRLRTLAATITCAAALGLVACGGDDDDETTTGATGATGAADVSDVRSEFNDRLRDVLLDAQGLSEAQADCAIQELDKAISDDDLESANETGEPSQDVLDAAIDAGEKCQDAG